MMNWPPKDPSDVLDYRIDWTALLDGDTIVTSIWAVTGGLVVQTQSATASTTTVWLTGGAVGLQGVKNTITTAAGRTFERTVSLSVEQL